MNKKKRIRYSELDAPAVKVPSVAAPVAPAPVAESPAVVPPPRPKRVSSPVELARVLAAPDSRPRPESARAREEFVNLLMFRIGHELFAVELLAVEEVIDLPLIHHVPEMPPAMQGVIMARGSLIPVYSPHQALGLPLAVGGAVLIFRRGLEGKRVGVLVDDVEDAISLDLRELRRTPDAEENDGVVLGVLRHVSAIVAIVDANALIAACQMAALQETA